MAIKNIDWKTFATSLPVIVAASAAAIGAFVAILPIVQRALHRPDSDVSMGIPLVTNRADFDIPLVNSGDRDARILAAQIILKTSNSLKAGDLELSAPPDYQPPLSEIGPNSKVSGFGVLRNSFNDMQQFVRDHENTFVGCSIEISIVNFRSGSKKIKKDFNCDVFADAMKTASAPGR